jgi:hypothetical protein
MKENLDIGRDGKIVSRNKRELSLVKSNLKELVKRVEDRETL